MTGISDHRPRVLGGVEVACGAIREKRWAPTRRRMVFFSFIAVLLIAGGLYRLVHLLPWSVPADFLRPNESYFLGIIFLLCAISLFRIGKGLCQGLMIKSMTGRNPLMVLELQPLGLAIETNAHQVWEGSPIQHLGFALASCVTPLTLAALVMLSLPNHPWERDLGLLALLWTFFELSPFRGSDFTWFFSRRAHGAHSEHLAPFLRKKSLLPYSREKISKVRRPYWPLPAFLLSGFSVSYFSA